MYVPTPRRKLNLHLIHSTGYDVLRSVRVRNGRTNWQRQPCFLRRPIRALHRLHGSRLLLHRQDRPQAPSHLWRAGNGHLPVRRWGSLRILRHLCPWRCSRESQCHCTSDWRTRTHRYCIRLPPHNHLRPLPRPRGLGLRRRSLVPGNPRNRNGSRIRSELAVQFRPWPLRSPCLRKH